MRPAPSPASGLPNDPTHDGSRSVSTPSRVNGLDGLLDPKGQQAPADLDDLVDRLERETVDRCLPCRDPLLMGLDPMLVRHPQDRKSVV